MSSTRKKLTNKVPAKPRPSTSFRIGVGFANRLRQATREHINKINEDRKRRYKLDAIINYAVEAVLETQQDLTPSEIAAAVTGVLHDLVREGVIEGTLPSDERIKSSVRSKLRPKPAKAKPLPQTEARTAEPQTTTPAVQHGFPAAVEARMPSADEQSHRLL